MATIGADEDESSRQGFREFLSDDDGRNFVMVNLIQYREKPLAIAGATSEGSSRETMDRYMKFMWPQLLKRACHPMVGGGAAAVALVVAIVGGYLWGRSDERAGRVEPLTETSSAKKAQLDVYYPATDPVSENEIRVVALGTGMQIVRPQQAAAFCLVQSVNGSKSTL